MSSNFKNTLILIFLLSALATALAILKFKLL